MKTFDPEVSVRLIKTIERTASSFDNSGNPANGTQVSTQRKAKRIIDLNPFLGEGCSVKTRNGVRDIAGNFHLVLNDRLDPLSMDSSYSLIEPMDIIEIRLAHAPYEYYAQGKKPPVILRGFVSEVHRETTIGQDGKPTRHVVVSGEDYGKLIKIYQIYYLNNAAMGQFHLSQFDFFKKYGDGSMTSMEDAKTFLSKMLTKVLNPFLHGFTFTNAGAVDGLPSVFTPKFNADGTISPYALAAFENVTLEKMLETILDIGAFNELFVEDQDDATYLVFRKAPFLAATNSKTQQFIQTGATAEFIDVDGGDLQSLSEARSDRGVANYYWASSHRWALMSDALFQLEAQSSKSAATMIKFDYPNCSTKRYGLRRMNVDTNMGPVGVVSNTGNGKAETERQSSILGASWIDSRRRILSESNKDNVVFESGNMRLRGNERIKAGRYIRLNRGEGGSSLYYAVSVEHEYLPFVSYSTMIQYERGTGFIDRVSRETSPYLAENNLEGFK